MSNAENANQPPKHSRSRKGSMKRITRRGIIAAGGSAKHNIRVNSISPLAIDTPQLRASFAAEGITYNQAAASFVTPRIQNEQN